VALPANAQRHTGAILARAWEAFWCWSRILSANASNPLIDPPRPLLNSLPLAFCDAGADGSGVRDGSQVLTVLARLGM